MILDISKYMSRLALGAACAGAGRARAGVRCVLLSAALFAAACTSEAPACRVDSDAADTLRGDAGCLIVSSNKTLLVVHRFGGKLGFPGGGAHGDEPAQCTAHRETWEETGLDVTVGALVQEFRAGFLLYACDPGPGITTDSAPPLKSWKLEISGLTWRDAVRETTWRDWRFPSQRRAARDFVRDGAAAGGQ